MGVYTNYEVDFDTHINWDDLEVRAALRNFSCHTFYLRDMIEDRAIVSVYSQHHINDILKVFYDLYKSGMQFRHYGTQDWKRFIINKQH
jgi:hypothetical protein